MVNPEGRAVGEPGYAAYAAPGAPGKVRITVGVRNDPCERHWVDLDPDNARALALSIMDALDAVE